MNTNNKVETRWMSSVVLFLKSTTLHGFKYLCSQYYVDRVGWLVLCFASTLGAGLLCTVLWGRFLEVPALLELSGLRPNIFQHMPVVAVCPPPETVTMIYLDSLSDVDKNATQRLPVTVARLLSGKTAAEDQMTLLDQVWTFSDPLLFAGNMSITDMMLRYMPPCVQMITKCRWQNLMVPCEYLFDIEITSLGTCCVMRPEKAYFRLANVTTRPDTHLESKLNLDLVLQCSNESFYGCQYFTKYDGEETVESLSIMPGFNYFAQLRFQSIPQSSADKSFVGSDCISDKSYSKLLCLDKCAESSCGCSDPFREKNIHEHYLPPCSATQLTCLRSYDFESYNCNCLQSCHKVITYTTMEYSNMTSIEATIDSLYSETNATTSTVLFIEVDLKLSRRFALTPTETWLTLLSSMGGVFNMFLGVGLFSALEILFFLFFKLPAALRRASEITISINNI